MLEEEDEEVLEIAEAEDEKNLENLFLVGLTFCAAVCSLRLVVDVACTMKSPHALSLSFFPFTAPVLFASTPPEPPATLSKHLLTCFCLLAGGR